MSQNEENRVLKDVRNSFFSGVVIAPLVDAILDVSNKTNTFMKSVKNSFTTLDGLAGIIGFSATYAVGFVGFRYLLGGYNERAVAQAQLPQASASIPAAPAANASATVFQDKEAARREQAASQATTIT